MRRPAAAFVIAALAAAAVTLSTLRAAESPRPQGNAAPRPLAAAADDARPGLAAVYRALAGGPALERMDLKPALLLRAGSVHPRLPPGPFEARWSGLLLIDEEEPISLSARAAGEISITLGGVKALQGRGDGEDARLMGTPLELSPGLYPIVVEYRSPPGDGLPSRLQLSWEGKSFGPEPLPAWRLRHLARDEPASLREEELRERGRAAAGRWGCARCHPGAFHAADDPPPGPALAGMGDSLDRAWLLRWLEAPATVRAGARMPALFPAGREGFVERWIAAEHLLRLAGGGSAKAAPPKGDHRPGRKRFISLGCPACHVMPDAAAPAPGLPRTDDRERHPLSGLGDRMSGGRLSAFIEDPRSRYPDGRMPRLPVAGDAAQDIAAFLLLWAPPRPPPPGRPQGPEPQDSPPTAEEMALLFARLAAADAAAAGEALLREKRCERCHTGLPAAAPLESPLPTDSAGSGCLAGLAVLAGRSGPRFEIDAETRGTLAAYMAAAGGERHASPLEKRRRLLVHHGCFRCHSRDGERPPPLEVIASELGGSNLETIPFQRTPRLNSAHQKYTAEHLLTAVRDGVSGVRPPRYSYRMPGFGEAAGELVLALAEADGDLPSAAERRPAAAIDPTLAGAGAQLAGFEGYSCVSCHAWEGRLLAEPDPGAIGPELTSLTGRVRRAWFDLWLEDPSRIHPRTPMPKIFPRGERGAVASLLDGDPKAQRDALWSYFMLGKAAAPPRPPAPLEIPAPAPGAPFLVAQIPLHLQDGSAVESIAVLSSSGDLLVYDVGRSSLHGLYTGARLLRSVKGRLRRFNVEGKRQEITAAIERAALDTVAGDTAAGAPLEASATFEGYDRLPDGVRIRSRSRGAAGPIRVVEMLRLAAGGRRELVREVSIDGAPPRIARMPIPPAQAPAPFTPPRLPDPGPVEGSLERPGYRAIAYPRPRSPSGEDLLQPSALAVNPRDGRVFVASMKTGQVLILEDPDGDGRRATFRDYTGGLFQEAYSMLAEADALYILHRRNFTRVLDTDGDGIADRFERVLGLPHGVADTYDYGYGLARDRTGAFVFSHAPYANTKMPGSGGALRLIAGEEPRVEELAYGFRNPIGWCAGPDGEVFATDNQGEWVAANKLCHIAAGRYYGFPNSEQRAHISKPAGRAAVWVPYGWARSINGVTCDTTGGKFGPFAGQLFLAELMFGGAIIRVSLEKVNGEYQGACFPFWGKGLLGPLVLAFDPRGRLYVGSDTEPGWMAQPDRGALYRIDFTGRTPFEIRSIHARPDGFRLVFTAPAAPEAAADRASYSVEHYRYEYTGAYGSPELDRTAAAVLKAEPAADGLSVDLTTDPLVKGRIYSISATGVRSAGRETLVHPTGVYTLNEVPSRS